MSNDESPCESCQGLAMLGLGKCIIHTGEPVPAFSITEEMQASDKFNSTYHDRLDKDVEIAMNLIDFCYADSPVAMQPETPNPVA